LPDLTSVSLRFAAELLLTLLVKVVGGIRRQVRAHRHSEPISLKREPSPGAEFLNAPLSVVWEALSRNFGVQPGEVRAIHLRPDTSGGWHLTVQTDSGAYEASVEANGMLVRISKPRSSRVVRSRFTA
jgi:hypothetical protein